MQKNACAALATALLLGSFSIPSLASGTEQLASFLKGTHSASGSFSQVTADRKGKTGQAMSGVFKFQRPGKVCLELRKALRAGHLLQRPDDFCLGSGSETGDGEGNCFLHAVKPGGHSFRKQ